MATDQNQAPTYVFLSYASPDRERALYIADLLEARGIPGWIDRKSIAGGTSWSAEIVRGIEGCAALVVLLSPAAVASPNVQQEVQLAWESRRPILPLLLAGVQLPEAFRYPLAGRQWIEILDRTDEVWLADTLRALRGLGIAAPQVGTSTPMPILLAGAFALAPASLPTPTTAFIGRAAEVAALADRLRLPDVRLLTLSGPGGVGKTRLGIEVAHSLTDAFPDGVYFVPLDTAASPESVLPTVAQVTGAADAGGAASVRSLAAAIGKRRLLLLLDNVEQVAAAAPDLGALLVACPALKLLVTSRRALLAYGEHEYPVQPLAIPEGISPPSLEHLARLDAIQLFLARARAVRPQFALTAENAPAVLEICRRLDGLPLAIELAAARCRLFSPAQILAHLDRRLAFLTSGAADLPARQRTLRGAVAWSYDLLTAEEQALFRQLAVFVGGFDWDAAAAVVDLRSVGPSGSTDDDSSAALDVLVDGLDALVRQSLLVQEDGGDGPRFAMLETLREFGLEKAEASGELVAVQGRHAQHYLGLVEMADTRLGQEGEARVLTHLDREYGNARAALAWLADSNQAQKALCLAAGLGTYWQIRGYFVEGRTWLQRGLALAPSPDALASITYKQARARALRALAGRFPNGTDLGETRGQADEGLVLAREAGDPELIGELLWTVGLTAQRQGLSQEARAIISESLAIWRQRRNRFKEARCRYALGDCAFDENNFAEAAGYYEESRATLVELKAAALLVDIDLAIAFFSLSQGKLDEAKQLLDRTLQAAIHGRFGFYTLGALLFYSCYAAARGQHQRALRLASAVDAMMDETLMGSASPVARFRIQQWRAASRAAVGEEAAAAAVAEGAAMTLEQVVAYALSDDS